MCNDGRREGRSLIHGGNVKRVCTYVVPIALYHAHMKANCLTNMWSTFSARVGYMTNEERQPDAECPSGQLSTRISPMRPIDITLWHPVASTSSSTERLTRCRPLMIIPRRDWAPSSRNSNTCFMIPFRRTYKTCPPGYSIRWIS